MNKKNIIEVIGESISSLSDKDFINLCDRLLHKLFPNSLNSPAISDNGFAFFDNSVFIVIPSDNSESFSIEKLIPSTLSVIEFSSLVFLSKDSLQFNDDQRIFIRKIIDKKRFDIWGIGTIKLKLSLLAVEDLHFVLGTDSLFSDYLSQEQSEQDEIDIIHNIFNYIKNNAKTIKKIPKPDNDIYSGIKKKINFNFSEYQSRVFDMYQLTLYYKTLVEKYIQETNKHDKTEVIILREFIRSSYLEIADVHWTTHPVNDYRIIEQLSEICVAEKFKGNKKYQLYSKAIVMYFFEFCDFGSRDKKDTLPPSDPILFENLNEDLN